MYEIKIKHKNDLLIFLDMNSSKCFSRSDLSDVLNVAVCTISNWTSSLSRDSKIRILGTCTKKRMFCSVYYGSPAKNEDKKYKCVVSTATSRNFVKRSEYRLDSSMKAALERCSLSNHFISLVGNVDYK